ncbi:DUF1801 domain-containing protein [Taibaiella chishuiensis]|uniref:Uncharacterized protein DUF1801 n=1 Tax=Taibaiella chishuiensis TaxID=1434707 RepID=A0A2P8CSQ8_9BACT|nr:DUF1801 domain-containing protein [Taibaiella chishuiensis]PSK87982.1 uncharacterized protein DUF1801 [Taibaiella chishuiensis]
MLSPADRYFQNKEEPIKSCLLFMRQYILKYDGHLTEAWKYGMPFFCYGKKMCCYLWVHKKLGQPYLGIVEGGRIDHPLLLQEARSRMKILLLDPDADLPLDTIHEVLDAMLGFYR